MFCGGTVIMIFDAHSHIGHDWMMTESTMGAYEEVLNKCNVCGGILMPEPGHMNQETQKRYMMWNFNESGEIYYYSPHGSTNSREYLSKTTVLTNDDIYARVQSYETDKKIFYSAMINPIIDDLDFYDKIYDRYRCVALKLHGIAGGYGPDMICEEQIYHIKQTRLPLIVHTDYSRKDEGALSTIRNMNHPRKWFEFLQKNGLKGYLCHGCRLDIDLLKDISACDNIMVGIGPDLAIQRDVNRIISAELLNYGYLNNLLECLPADKIVFDIDFNYMEGDLDFVARLTNLLNQDKGAYEKIMVKNADTFFGLNLL